MKPTPKIRNSSVRNAKRRAADDENQLDLISDHGPAVKDAAQETSRAATNPNEAGKSASQQPEIPEPTPDDPDAEVPESRQDLGALVCTKRNIVQVASDLLSSGSDAKGAAVKLRMWQAVVESLFGKPGSPDDDPPQVVLAGLPRPNRDLIEGEES